MNRFYIVLGSILLILSCLSPISSSAQTADGGVGNRWNFGFNMGGMWQEKNEVEKNKAGIAGGFTFGRHYLYNTNSPVYLGLRFRYLAGLTYGKDYHRSRGLLNNNVLNGTYDPLLDYDSIPGYYFHNYRTTVGEMSLELSLGLNKLRKRTGILLYVFGGVGISSHLTRMNVSGPIGAYDYTQIDTTSVAATKDDLDFMYDLNYETFAEGNKDGKEVYHFSATGGIGLGKMLGKHVALGMEYKVTQPLTGEYRMDGKNWDNNNIRITGSPQYHYWGGYIKLFWGGGHTHTTPRDTHVVHHHNPPPPPSGIPPQIVITDPGMNFTTPYERVTIRGTVTNINYQSSIRVKVNGMTHTDFMWNSSTKGISINTPLRPGPNLVEIRATNQWGADEKSITINYQQPVNLRPAPVVNITVPGSGTFTTGSSMQNVTAMVLNIDNGSQIQVSLNYQPLTSFYYDVTSKQLSFTAVLNQGNNPVVITATNESGTGSASVVINYMPVSTGAKPIITILNPPVNPSNSTMSVANVSAQVLNVSGPAAITVKANNVNLPFQYSNSNKSLQFQVPLMPGANTVIITATNQFGMDSKAVTINYIELAPPQKPEVIFTNPAVDPYAHPVQSMMVTADIHHVNSSADIQVTFNGIPVNSFSYNPSTDQFALQVSLVQGANVMVIGAVNNAGMDSKSTTIIYQPVQQTPKPIVTITNPAVNPYNTGVNTHSVSATILNITSQGQIIADHNGIPTTNFTYNTTTKVLNMNVNLINGANVVTIKATNSAGSDAKNVTINYVQQMPKPVVTITIPNTNPFTTSNLAPNINATVLNVPAANAISVTVNGNPYPNFIYSTTTKILSMSPVLLHGANNITITATNASGSDAKSQVINVIDQPKPVLPVVTITTPASNPYASKDCKLKVIATIDHILGQNDISVTMNGNPFTAFTWNGTTKTLDINSTQNVGNSYTFLITATNQWGSDAKSVTINCPTTVNTPSPTPPPVVTITQPNPATVNITGLCQVNISATIQNVSSPNEITVKRNGQPWTNYLWNPVLKVLTINAPMMNAGNYVFEIRATTSAGSDAKTVTYNCQDAPPPPPPPPPRQTPPT
ncbi:MAG: hypothetical protein IT233_12790, partial [Bacteroidia bacterium]|nr:hypothetical protein [Bacteroidia bacterium]